MPPPYRKGAKYHCKSNDKPLVFDESARENYSYPWQDNFCEARDFEVGQCANGYGHQGQDIRPATCKKNIHWVVAAEEIDASEADAVLVVEQP